MTIITVFAILWTSLTTEVIASPQELCLACKCSTVDIILTDEKLVKLNDEVEEAKQWSPTTPVLNPWGMYLEVNCSHRGLPTNWPPTKTIGFISDFSGNGFEKFPPFPEIIRKKMFQLSLARNEISDIIMDDIRDYQDLRALNMNYNRIQRVDEFLFSLPARLLRLDLSGNRIEYVGKIVRHSSLIYLDLSHNLITSLEPDGLRGLKNLLFLDLSNNKLSSTPDDFGSSLAKLKFFNAAVNKLQRIPHLPKSVRTVNVSTNGLNSVELPRIDQLLALDVSNNSLNELDDVRDQLSLKILKASHNHLSRVGKWESPELKVLDFSYNKFEIIPAEINGDYLPHLKELNFNGNPIKNLSFEERAPFPDLDILGLSNLNLRNINAESFKGLIIESYVNCSEESGISIDLSRNKLKTLPVNTFKTFPVCSIDLSYNNIVTIPKELFDWKNLRSGNLQHNPWNCACDLQWMINEYVTHFYKTEPATLLDLRCETPIRLKGRMMVYWYNSKTDAFCQGLSYYQYEYAEGEYFEIWTVSAIICAILVGLIILVVLLIIILVLKRAIKTKNMKKAKNINKRRSKPLFSELRITADHSYKEIRQDVNV